ncbi:tyrosine-type recombinase/integrase [Rahnella aceris]|uniref:tyrosine-type DNA invertase n=1 Tax=Rahnella sp. (strain Y9602) TaxID=2703885 RepID=UPI001C25E958|nr:tyrosine-type DNA invertase [Rahnella aceris]MBU9839263.1 tyrosine-type recombinase/integrase [Rahnella aceris]
MSRRLYLTYREVQHIYQATGDAKHHIRDRCMILMCFLHGFRTSELIGLKISDIDYLSENIYIRRLKNGLSTTHPLHPKERELLQQWMEVRKTCANNTSDWLFLTSRGHCLSRQRFYSLLRHYGELANIPLKVHPHMLRHACGFELAEQGLDTRLIQDYLGHRNIRHTVHYTASNAARFTSAWRVAHTLTLPQKPENLISSW